MTKFEAAKKHIELREQFFGKKYNMVQRAYGHFRMFFHSQELIESASKGLVQMIANYGNFQAMKKQIEG